MKIQNNFKIDVINKDNVTYSCQYFVIWTTKFKRNILDENMQKTLKMLILEKQKDFNYNIIQLDIKEDNIKLIIDINPKISIYKIISDIKGDTSRNLKNIYPRLNSRIPTIWNRYIFIHTLGNLYLNDIENYLNNQKGI